MIHLAWHIMGGSNMYMYLAHSNAFPCCPSEILGYTAMRAGNHHAILNRVTLF